MYNVLIVDDDPLILEGLHYIVDWEALGLQIVCAVSNGVCAKEYIENNRVHILLTDIRMPELDGLELIQWIREQKLDIHCIVLSGYDDYQYLKRALQLKIDNYLLKSVNEEELLESLAYIVEKLDQQVSTRTEAFSGDFEESIMLRWVSGRISPEEFDERVGFLKKPIGSGSFQVCVLRLFSNDTKTAKTALATFKQMEFAQTTMHVFRDIDQDIVFIYSGNSELQLNSISQTLEWEISCDIYAQFLFTVGQIVESKDCVSESYRAAKHLQGYCLTCPIHHVFRYNHPFPESRKRTSLSSSELEAFRQALMQQSYAGAVDFLNDFFLKEYDYTEYSAMFVQTTALKLSYILADAARLFYINAPELLMPTDQLYKVIIAFQQRNSLLQWITRKVHMFFQLKRKGVDNPLLERMINYIDNHFEQDISLKTIAATLNTNPAYLGRIFKDATGSSFSDYLNVRRIDCAKALLVETSLTVKDIAAKSGYNSTNYFVNVFKKHTALYPIQYRTTHIRFSKEDISK